MRTPVKSALLAAVLFAACGAPAKKPLVPSPTPAPAVPEPTETPAPKPVTTVAPATEASASKPAPTPIADAYRDVAKQLLDVGVKGGTAYAKLAYLTDHVGHRIAGSKRMD